MPRKLYLSNNKHKFSESQVLVDPSTASKGVSMQASAGKPTLDEPSIVTGKTRECLIGSKWTLFVTWCFELHPVSTSALRAALQPALTFI